MHAALVHQGAGHDPVIDEMAGDEPVVRVDVCLGADESDPAAPALGVEFHDAVHELHPAAGYGQRAFQLYSLEKRPEAAGEIAVAQGVQLKGAVGGFLHLDQLFPVGGKNSGTGAQIESTAHDPLAGIEFCL